ncbi:MAG: SEL1-like repeat protein [Bdellovibrionota bacterium]
MSSNVIRSVIVILLVVFCPKGQAERSDGGRLQVPMSAPTKQGPKMQALMAKAYEGNASAQFQLAQIYDKGNQWVRRDPAAAIAWYEEAAGNGHTAASRMLKTR